MSDEKKILKRNLWFFPLGTVGRDMLYQLFTNYILLFVYSCTAYGHYHDHGGCKGLRCTE